MDMNKKKMIGFEKGIGQIRMSDFPEFKKKIMYALGVSTLQSVRRYSKGLREMKESQSIAVKEVFESYGITDFRDDEPCND